MYMTVLDLVIRTMRIDEKSTLHSLCSQWFVIGQCCRGRRSEIYRVLSQAVQVLGSLRAATTVRLFYLLSQSRRATSGCTLDSR
jgi:hypothetical protein